MRGRWIKNRKREEAEARQAAYVPTENPKGLKERVKRGKITLEDAKELASGPGYHEGIRNWLSHQKPRPLSKK